MIRREATPASAAASPPPSTFDMYSLIGLFASTAAQFGEFGVARPSRRPGGHRRDAPAAPTDRGAASSVFGT